MPVPFYFEMPFLLPRGRAHGWRAGSAGGEYPVEDSFPSVGGGGKGMAICAPRPIPPGSKKKSLPHHAENHGLHPGPGTTPKL